MSYKSVLIGTLLFAVIMFKSLDEFDEILIGEVDENRSQIVVDNVKY